MTTALTVVAASLCAIALLYLASVLHRRYPAQPHTPGSWTAPMTRERWAGREPGFDLTVNQIEKAKLSRADWDKLLTHLDTIADELDPTSTPGKRRVVPFDRGMRFWLPIDRAGAPKAYHRHYLAARLTAIEHRNAGAQRG